MCHGDIDPRLLMREAEDRIRAAQHETDTAEPPATRPVWDDVVAGVARLARLIARRRPAD